jgi:hypothetical protein
MQVAVHCKLVLVVLDDNGSAVSNFRELNNVQNWAGNVIEQVAAGYGAFVHLCSFLCTEADCARALLELFLKQLKLPFQIRYFGAQLGDFFFEQREARGVGARRRGFD